MKKNGKTRANSARDLRLGIQKPYLVTFHARVDGKMSDEQHRELVQFAVNGTDAEDQIMRKHRLPTNERSRYIVRTVQCHGGPATMQVTPFAAQLKAL